MWKMDVKITSVKHTQYPCVYHTSLNFLSYYAGFSNQRNYFENKWRITTNLSLLKFFIEIKNLIRFEN